MDRPKNNQEAFKQWLEWAIQERANGAFLTLVDPPGAEADVVFDGEIIRAIDQEGRCVAAVRLVPEEPKRDYIDT